MSRAMRLRELLPDVAGIPADLCVRGLVMDSREVQPGDAFVAIAGFGTHGLKFAAQARSAGAAAILFEPPASTDVPAPEGAIAVPRLRARLGEMADRFHGRLTDAMTIVGVTGTNGKTTAMIGPWFLGFGIASAQCAASGNTATSIIALRSFIPSSLHFGTG